MIALPSSPSTSPYLSSGGACADHVLSRCSCGDALPVACLLREVLRLWGGGPASVDFNHVPCVLLWPLAERRDRLFAILVPESWTCALIDRRAVNCNKALLPQSPSLEAPGSEVVQTLASHHFSEWLWVHSSTRDPLCM